MHLNIEGATSFKFLGRFSICELHCSHVDGHHGGRRISVPGSGLLSPRNRDPMDTVEENMDNIDRNSHHHKNEDDEDDDQDSSDSQGEF